MSNWILLIEWVNLLLLLTLFGLSIWSVAIMIDRLKVFREIDREKEKNKKIKSYIDENNWQKLEVFSENDSALCTRMFSQIIKVGVEQPESVDRATKSFLTDEKEKLERGFTTLATLGSNAPFIGLFGTVLGIIQAFGALAEQQVGSSSVMSAISEALVMTAVGLFVAIPAVIAFNYFNNRLQTVLSGCESLKDYYLSKRVSGSNSGN